MVTVAQEPKPYKINYKFVQGITFNLALEQKR